MIAGTTPCRLHFVGDKQTAILSRYRDGFFEISGWRDDEPAGADHRFGEERRDLSTRFGLDQLFNVLGALQPALGILKIERAAITVRRVRVMNAGDILRHLLPV